VIAEAIPRLGPSDIAELEGIIRQWKQHTDTGKSTEELDEQFHRILYRSLWNTTLDKILEVFWIALHGYSEQVKHMTRDNSSDWKSKASRFSRKHHCAIHPRRLRPSPKVLDSVLAGERNASDSATGVRLEFYPPDCRVEPHTPSFKVRGKLSPQRGLYHICRSLCCVRQNRAHVGESMYPRNKFAGDYSSPTPPRFSKSSRLRVLGLFLLSSASTPSPLG